MNLLGRGIQYFLDAMRFARSGTKRQRNPLATKILQNASMAASSANQADVDYFARLAVTNPGFTSGMDRITNRIGDYENLVVQMRRNNAADSDDDSEWEDATDHPFIQVLANPNSFMPGFLLLAETAMWLNSYGNHYWFLVTDEIGVGPIREIWPLPANKTYPDPLTLRRSSITDKLTVDYRYNAGAQILLPGESIVHFRTPNLFDYWQGMAKLTSLQQALSMDMSESKYLNSFFDEGNAVPSAIVSVPREVTDTELNIIERDIQEQFGARRATAVVRSGDMDVKILQHTIEEMQVLQGMDFNAKRIQDVLGVPSGLSSASSGQARLAAEIAFAKDVIQPMLNAMAAFCNLKISPMYAMPGQMRITAKNVIPQDSAIEIAEYETYRPDDTINGNRKKRNLKPIQMTGKLQKFQQYLDEVPVEILHDLLAAETGGAGAPAGMPPGAALGAGAPNTRTPPANAPQRNGVPARKGRREVAQRAGVRQTGQPTPKAEVKNLLKSVMLPEELDTLNLLL